MKQIRIIVATCLVALSAAVVWTGCQKEQKNKINSEIILQKSSTPIHFSSNEQLNNALIIHNRFMEKTIDGHIVFHNNEEMTDALIEHMKLEFKEIDENTIRESLDAFYNEYSGLFSQDIIDKMYSNQTVSLELHNALTEVVSSLESVPEKADFKVFNATLIETVRRVDTDFVLTTTDRERFNMFIDVVKNGSDLYASKSAATSKCCNDCLKRKKRDIILGDAAAAIAGIVGCFVYPPACPYLLPALIAAGSAGVIAYRCPCCF
ncbi:MAG: hypothetical protein ACLGGV_00485 [Bacteroidia bacterium]